MTYQVEIDYNIVSKGEEETLDFPAELVKDILGCQKHLQKKWNHHIFVTKIWSGVRE